MDEVNSAFVPEHGLSANEKSKTGLGFTVTVTGSVATPLTRALKFPAVVVVYEIVVAFGIAVQIVPSADDSHCIDAPGAAPVTVSIVLFPAQKLVAPVMVWENTGYRQKMNTRVQSSVRMNRDWVEG